MNVLLATCLSMLLIIGHSAYARIGSKCATDELKLDVNTFLDPNDKTVQAPPLVPAQVVPVILRGPTDATQTPLLPKQLLEQGLLAKVDSFPSTVVQYDDRIVRFVGVYLVRNPIPDPCIRTLVKAFAPQVIPDAKRGGQRFIMPGDHGAPRLEIDAFERKGITYGGLSPLTQSPASAPLTADITQTFFVINLTEISDERARNNIWQHQVELYEKAIEGRAGQPAMQMVLFERFLLDLLRYYRYHARSVGRDRRDEFEGRVIEQLAAGAHGVRCSSLVRADGTRASGVAYAIPRQCILLESLLRNELGPADPFTVSDALGNSGLAIGPHQMDLGQYPEFGEKILLVNQQSEVRRRELKQYFTSLERLSPYGFKTLYEEAIPTFNRALQSKEAQDFIIADFVKTINEPLPAAKEIELVDLVAPEKAAFEAVVMDFYNKWGNRTQGVAKAMQKRHYNSICEATIGWLHAFESTRPLPADMFDARRRASTVLRAFSSFQSATVEDCVSQIL